MESKLVPSFAEAVRDIPDGASILIGGFGIGPGAANNLVRALYFQGAHGLTVISNSAGGASTVLRDDLITIANLIDARRVRKAIFSFTAAPHPSIRTPVEALQDSGEIEAELVPQGTLAERIRAGGAGIPAFYTPAGAGTELAQGKEPRIFDGRPYLLEEAITADYAFVRCWRADEFGNLLYRGSQRSYNPIMAMAARCTIVEAEEVVPVGTIEPDQVHTPGIFVHRIVLIPPPPEGILHVTR